MYDINTWISEIEAEAARKGLRANKFCELAEVNPSTWSQIRKGKQKPNLGTMQKITNAIEGYNNDSGD